MSWRVATWQFGDPVGTCTGKVVEEGVQLLAENGDSLLTEDGDFILLED